MAGTSKIKAPAGTTPRFNQEAIEIALHMAQYPAEELGRMLKLSPKLMMESYHRFQNFHSAEEEPLQAFILDVPAIVLAGDKMICIFVNILFLLCKYLVIYIRCINKSRISRTHFLI